MPAYPRFLGGPTLGSNLGDVTTAKSAIVGQMLAIIFPGIVMYLVQGSPSGSSASGGTHADEIGDAGDWVYRYPDGRTVPLIVYLVASLLWRMLDCLSYVRGADVDKNGVKDDPFSLHNHIIDREGGPKVQAVRDQIALYLRHLDGLVGGRADREAVVPQPMTLAEYQTPAGQATFLFRFQQLTSEALGLAAHIEPTRRRKAMLYKANTGVYFLVTDNNVQVVEPAYVAAATLQWGAPVDALAADITRLQELTRANRIQGHADVTSATVTATIDPAVLKAAIDAVLADVSFTTRKA